MVLTDSGENGTSQVTRPETHADNREIDNYRTERGNDSEAEWGIRRLIQAERGEPTISTASGLFKQLKRLMRCFSIIII